MRKILICTLLLMVCLTATAYAEVQNVKVGGDIRIRGVYSDNTLTLDKDSNDQYDKVYQRTRVNVEADLTEEVIVATTLEAKSLWGADDSNLTTTTTSSWDTGVSQAYVLFKNLLDGNISLKLGRQYLHFGKGFLISSKEGEYNFDAARLTMNFAPWVIDIVLASLGENDTISGDVKDKNLIGANVGYIADGWNAEGYVWKILDSKDGEIAVLSPAYKPLVLGVRGDTSTLAENLDIWGELALEKGEASPVRDYGTAYAVDLGGKYAFDATSLKPTLTLAYTMGSGDDSSSGDTKTFNELYEYNYYGYVYSPLVSNIHIINVGLTIEPAVDLELGLDYYNYRQHKKLVQTMGNANQDNGGVLALTNGTSKTLGNEVDVTATYKYSEDVTTQVLAGWFRPGSAYSSSSDDTAYEIRGEILVNF